MTDPIRVIMPPPSSPASIVVITEDGGPPGPQGPQGPPGVSGATFQWSGHGPPALIIGAQPGDRYLDLDTGDVYDLI